MLTGIEKRDYLWLNISSLPYFRGLLRAVEGRFYEDIELPGPTLDLGCGDGHFASVTFKRKLDVGLDPWKGPLRLAQKLGSYRMVVEGLGNKIPFPDASFGSAVSNSVLEHISDLDPVLADLARVLKPGAIFTFCVPNEKFLPTLSISNFFDKIGLRFLGNAYRGWFNWIARHIHCDDQKTWSERLEKAGFKVEQCWDYFSPQAMHVLEWGHYFGLPSLVTRKIFGRWIVAPTRWNLAPTMVISRKIYAEPPQQPQGVCTFYIARRL